MEKKRDPLISIAKDILQAAIDLEVFNIQQLSSRSGHPWATVKRVLSLYLLKDLNYVGFIESEVPKHYKIVPLLRDHKRGLDKELKRRISKAKV